MTMNLLWTKSHEEKFNVPSTCNYHYHVEKVTWPHATCHQQFSRKKETKTFTVHILQFYSVFCHCLMFIMNSDTEIGLLAGMKHIGHRNKLMTMNNKQVKDIKAILHQRGLSFYMSLRLSCQSETFI